MGIREELEKLKKPGEREVPQLGKVFFRRLTFGEVLAFSPLPLTEYNQALLAASAQDEEGRPLFASREEVAALPSNVYINLRDAYKELNPIGLDAAAKKIDACAILTIALFVGERLHKSLDEMRLMDEEDVWLQASWLLKHKPPLKDAAQIEAAFMAYAAESGGKIIRPKFKRKRKK